MSKDACVNVTAGIVTLEVTDLWFPGFIPFSLTRSYRSNSTADGLLGPCWGVNLGEDIVTDAESATLSNAEGREVRFALPLPGGDPVGNRVNGGVLSADQHPVSGGHAIVYSLRSGNRIRRYARVDGSPRYRLLRIEDLHGNALRFRYQGGRLVEIEDTVQRRFVLEHDAHGRLLEVQLLGRAAPTSLVSYGYEADGMLGTVSKSPGALNRYRYADGLLVVHTNDYGVHFFNVYDGSRRCIRSWRGSGYHLREYHYDHKRYQTLVVNSLGASTLYRYNEFNLVTETVDALGGVSRFQHDEGNNIILAVNQSGSATLIGYDEANRPVDVTRADGATETFKYDPEGRPSEYVNPAGGVSRAEYNSFGDLAASIAPNGAVTRFEYDGRGATREIIFDNGEKINREYGADFIRFLHDGQPVLERRYDGFGRPTAVEYRGAYRIEFRYDPLGRMAQEVGVDGAVRQRTYDATGRVSTLTDERGRTTVFHYNEIGLVTATQRGSQRTEYAYDTEARLIEIRNSREESHRIEYDLLGRMQAQRFFDGRTERYSRDAAGAIRSIRDGAGREITYEVDPLGRPLRVRHSDGTRSSFQYAPGGAVVRAERDDYVVEFEYDAEGRVLLQRQDALELQYEYDLMGRLHRMADSEGRSVTLDRDALKRARGALLEQQATEARYELAFSYDPLNALQRVALGQDLVLERECNGWRKPTVQRAFAGGRPVLEERYGYDRSGTLVTRESTHGNVVAYSYDAAGGLVQVTMNGTAAERYGYDTERNLVAKYWVQADGVRQSSLEYGPGNRLLRAGQRQYRYDESGLLTAIEEGGRETRFQYSDDDLLVRVDHPDGSFTEYQYDALRRRVAKRTSGGRKTSFYWDQQTLWAEHQLALQDDGEWLRIGAMQYYFDPLSWSPLAVIAEGKCQLAINDSIGTPHTLLDTEGAVTWQVRSNAWGETIAETAPAGSRMPVRFPGQYADAETGLHYNLNRYYDPSSGRYTSPDPIGLLGGVNAYSYTADPVNSADPLGLECQNYPQGEPPTLYRGDSRPPSDICGKGFSPRNPGAAVSIFEHVGGKTGSWVSTSYDYDTASRPLHSEPDHYVYVIANPACAANPGHEVDCDPEIQARQEQFKQMGMSPEPSEYEIAFKNVPPNAVLGYVHIAPDGTVGDFTTC